MFGSKCFSRIGFAVGSFGTISILFFWAYSSVNYVLSMPLFYIFTAILSAYNGIIGGVLNLYVSENYYFLGFCDKEKNSNISLLLVFFSIVIPPIYFDRMFPNALNNSYIIFWIIGYAILILLSIKIGSVFREKTEDDENLSYHIFTYLRKVYAKITNSHDKALEN